MSLDSFYYLLCSEEILHANEYTHFSSLDSSSQQPSILIIIEGKANNNTICTFVDTTILEEGKERSPILSVKSMVNWDIQYLKLLSIGIKPSYSICP